MPWAAIIPAATAAAGMVGGALKARAANQYADKQNAARLQELRYKPFGGTEVRSSTPGSSMFGEMLGGAATGAQTGLALTNMYSGVKDALAKAGKSVAGGVGGAAKKAVETATPNTTVVPGQQTTSYYNPPPVSYNANQYSSVMTPPSGVGVSDQSWETFLAKNPLQQKADELSIPQTSNVMNPLTPFEPNYPIGGNLYSNVISPAVTNAMSAINAARQPQQRSPFEMSPQELYALYGTTDLTKINRYRLAQNGRSSWKAGV